MSLTGAPGMWSDFNEANKSAMLKSELISWPVTLAVLVLAFGSLVAAGLPLLLTTLGLVSAAGSLFLVSQAFDVSIWAMNLGVILGVAVLLDVMLIRLVLMPVLLRLLGRSAWVLPAWLDRVLPNVRFGHGEPTPAGK